MSVTGTKAIDQRYLNKLASNVEEERGQTLKLLAQTLWHELAQLPNDLAYGLDRETWCGWDRLTNPGYMGSNFRGVVFLAKNPGNGGPGGPSPLEKDLFSALSVMKSDARHFQRFAEAYSAGLRQWNVGRYIIEASAPLDEIAFLNLIPWRTDPEKMNAANWQDTAARGRGILSRQLALLGPLELVVLGKSTEDLFATTMPLSIKSIIIERSNGDRFTKPSAATALADLKQRMRW